VSNKIMSNILVKSLTALETLIKRGGGKRPDEARQPDVLPSLLPVYAGGADGEQPSRCQFLKGESLSR
jgi:hypothetical protein